MLEDYAESLAARASEARNVALPPSCRPLWLRTADFEQRHAWQCAPCAHCQSPSKSFLKFKNLRA
ncbi:MAG: hypothetical protein OXD30_10305, partial [Bryobacterales bacterium]|nr:hypothetical protein [Bryobacterales bacterium]